MAEGSYVTQKTFHGDGVQKVFNFAMDYLRKPFITVKVDSELQVYGVDYIVVDQEVHMMVAPAESTVIVVQRKTTTERLVVWQDASVLRAGDLTLFEVQLLHLQEETNDAVQTDVASLTLQAEAARDTAVTYRDEAGIYKDVAKSYRDEALIFRDSASSSASTATSQATIATTQAGVSTAQAGIATTKASEASTSATTATTQADIATTKASEALNSANKAEDSEDNAKLQADRAEALLTGHTVIVPTFPIGAPFPWFTSTRPDGTLLCNGQAFDMVAYPKLALVYPSGFLPDMRGVVPRGLDRGRGLDTDTVRTLGDYQPDQNKNHVHTIHNHSADTLNGGSYTMQSAHMTSQTAWNTGESGGSEARMKNIACDWLVYATTLDYDLTINNGNAVTLGGYPASHFVEKSYIGNLPGNRVWLSNQLTLVNGVAQSIAHGITFTDTDEKVKAKVDCVLYCLITDLGYSVGDIATNVTANNVTGGTYNTPLCPSLSGTHVSIVTPTNIGVRHKTTGVLAGITPANWGVILRIKY